MKDEAVRLAGNIPLATVQFQCTFLGDGQLPSFLGPTLRGGFGHHLKKTVCHTRSSSCQDCIIQKNCAYSYIFEGVPPENREFMRLYPNIPQPFVLITELGRESKIEAEEPFQFGLRLFGRAIELFPYIVYSFMEIGKEGLGKDRIPFRIEFITQPTQKKPLYLNGDNCLGIPKKEKISAYSDENFSKVGIEFLSPTKLQVGGKEAASISFIELLKSACRRISILNYFYGSGTDISAELSEYLSGSEVVRVFSDKTQVYEINRFSGRQKQTMTLRGLIGKMTFEGDFKRYMPVLQLAQTYHIGKATSFGFGRINITQE